MINLKLAEYDLKTRKFNEFFDLGLNEPYSFGFYGNVISVYYAWIGESFCYDLDKKDPLKRFNGIFNGLTYGEGRFILIQDYEDTVTVDYNYEKITLYNIGSGYFSFSHGGYLYYKK
jgi:hypothetical protein